MNFYKNIIVLAIVCCGSVAAVSKGQREWNFLCAVSSGNIAYVAKALADDQGLANCTDERFYEEESNKWFGTHSGLPNGDTPLLSIFPHRPFIGKKDPGTINSNAIKIAQLLLSVGAKVDAADGSGRRTPLSCALEWGEAGLAQLFIDSGASVDLALKNVKEMLEPGQRMALETLKTLRLSSKL